MSQNISGKGSGLIPSPLMGEGKGGGVQRLSNKMVSVAKILRRRPTDTENLLWKHLRAKQLEGLKFRRQEVMGNYIVDFVCYEKRIVIEVDGGQHAMTKNGDNARDQWLKGEGFKVLRFWNSDVLTNIEGVLEVIRETCFGHPPLAPPIKGGGKRRLPTGKPEEPGKDNGDGLVRFDKRNAF